MFIILRKIPSALCLSSIIGVIIAATNLAQASAEDLFSWKTLQPGVQVATYYLGPKNQVLSSEVILVKVNLEKARLSLYNVSSDGDSVSNSKSVALRKNALVAINANFFDPKNKPLGLLQREGKTLSRLQMGGKLLTGVFYVSGNQPVIIHREAFKNIDTLPSLAIQAGPRLIVHGSPISLIPNNNASRRSGLAITKSNEVILYATRVRFPGATLRQIQSMLLEPELEVTEALNLDGGGSSQLYVHPGNELSKEIWITGGDEVPVFLLVLKGESRG